MSAIRQPPAVRPGKPAGRVGRPVRVAPRVVDATWDGGPVTAAGEATGWTADEAVTRLFAVHYRPLVRLASLLLADSGRAEEIVADAYVALHAGWRRLDDTDKALAYLRATVVNRSRSALRHRRVAERYLVRAAAAPALSAPAAEAGALDRLAHETVMAAVGRLPARQREAIVLRYYADLSEA